MKKLETLAVLAGNRIVNVPPEVSGRHVDDPDLAFLKFIKSRLYDPKPKAVINEDDTEAEM
jgi:hypothetical protein